MKKYRNLVGEKFGRLTVLALDEANNGRRRKWLCRCDCGEEKSIVGESLTGGVVASCGCLRRETTARLRFRDLTGMRFGRVLVISKADLKIARKTGWNCRCDCGSTVIRSQFDLTNSGTPSCGCYQLERVAKMGEEKRLPMRSGERFGRLTAISEAGVTSGALMMRFRCDCGGEKVLPASQVRALRVISCGCAVYDRPGLRHPRVNQRNAAALHKRRAMIAKVGGSFTATQIEELYGKQRGCCAGPNCGAKLGKRFHRDHIVALANGGTNDIGNIQLLCGPCNLRKHAKDPIDWAQQNGRLL